MYTNRFIGLLTAVSLLAVVVLGVREANATMSLTTRVDSATRSYTAWAEAVEAETSMVDSATRSYIAQAKAAACSMDAVNGFSLDSAARSYIAWGLALQAKEGTGAMCY